ncbi:MAG: DUF5995 family protein [Actinomycetota bacterium]|nr:DUF5995 family protein [Actinomycetota bacterium]
MLERSQSIDELIARMEEMLVPLERADDERQHFHATYMRTSMAFRAEIERSGFLDNEWVERWDLAFAQLYLDALDLDNRGEPTPGPWRIAFDACRQRSLPHLRYVLLGINAHVNYDLPQALLAVITDEEFDDPALTAKRASDHEHGDNILASRVPEEDRELAKVEGPGERTLLDRALQPFNRAGTKRFLKEARRKVWANARLLSRARRQGPDALAQRLGELEELSRARVAELREPGQVILRLAIRGFGVELAP